MPVCMRVFNRIECPTCGYAAAEAQYSLANAPYDPGCRYETGERMIPILGALELEEGYDDLQDVVDHIPQDWDTSLTWEEM